MPEDDDDLQMAIKQEFESGMVRLHRQMSRIIHIIRTMQSLILWFVIGTSVAAFIFMFLVLWLIS